MINYRNVLRVYKLERELAPDDVALLNTLREMPEIVRGVFAETLGLPVKAKAKATTKQRKVEHCHVCDRSGRAAVHKDTGLSDYHQFQSSKPKSPRAQSLATAIQQTPKSQVVGDGSDGPLCGVCGHTEDYEDHQQPSPHYHPFASPSPAPTAAGRSSSRNGSTITSIASSEDETESASSVAHGVNGEENDD